LKIEVDQLKVENAQLKAEQSWLEKEVEVFPATKEASFEKGYNKAFEDAKNQLAFICKSSFNKGYNETLVKTKVPAESDLFNEQKRGSPPRVEEETTTSVPADQNKDVASKVKTIEVKEQVKK